MNRARRPLRGAIVGAVEPGKSARKSAPGVAFKPGPDSRRGRGPKKGAPNAGRPTNAFKAVLAAQADRAAQALAAASILDDPDHPMFLDAAKWCADRGYGRAAQVIAGDVDQPLTIRVVRE